MAWAGRLARIPRNYVIADIAEKVLAGQRLSVEDGTRLFRHPDLPELGMLAGWVRRKKRPDRIVTYVVGRNINYTNVCWVRCKFCAFYRPPGSSEGYVLSKEDIFAKIRELVEVGGPAPGACEVLMQGGLNPRLKLEYYEDLLRAIKQRFPVHLHSLSATEIVYIAHISRLSLEECIQRLRDSGLDSIPGAGAEILSDEVRDTIGFRKDTVSEWLEVHRTAHRLGMSTTATMMYGHVETIEQRLEHLERVRDLQDQTRGFSAFIPWSFQPSGTELARDWNGRKATGFDYLRTTAVARLFLDNIDNVQASWVTQGPKIAQIGLHYGVNDFGSTMMEENVVSAAGTSFCMPISEIVRLIRDVGCEPVRRNTRYELLN